MTREEVNNIMQEEATRLLPGVKVSLLWNPIIYGVCNIDSDSYYSHEFKYKDYVCIYKYNAVKGFDRIQLLEEIVLPTVKALKAMEMKDERKNNE